MLFNGIIGGNAGLNAQPCIELLGTTTGIIARNATFCNVASAQLAIVADDCFLSGNTYSESESTSGSEAIGVGQNDALKALGILGLGTGNIFYCDSGNTSSLVDGKSWATAAATLDAAINLCTDNAGDVILVAPGHNESLTTADAVDADIAGLTIIGIGNGSLKPTFDYDANEGEFVIGDAGVTIKNLRFRLSFNAVLTAIDVESAGDEFAIIDCEFGWAETATDEFNATITVGDTANYGLIKGCTIKGGAAAAVSAIHLDADIVGITIEDNVIWGDFSTAVILGDEASDEIIIRRNILFNGTMGGDSELNSEPAIEVADDTSGFVLDNRIASDVATGLLMRVADDMVFMNNFIVDDDGDEFSGTTEDTAASITAHTDG